MQEIINRILEGNFDCESGTLGFSCSKIELTLSGKSIYEGSFGITSDSERAVYGYVVSSDMRMECPAPRFAGNSVEIPYRFDAGHMEEGDVLKGSFTVLSNCGEYHIPFLVNIEHSTIKSSEGEIKNLFHFANLAKSNWDEAVDIFYSDDFVKILNGTDSRYTDSYRGLASGVKNGQNVEEFLILINKKQRMDFFIKDREVKLTLGAWDDGDNVTQYDIEIKRVGWGYTALNVECDADFIFTEKEFICDDDFLGNTYRLPVFIDVSRCKRGVNAGRVYLFNSYVSYEINIEVIKGRYEKSVNTSLTSRQMRVKLVRGYIDYRLKKIRSGAWHKETGRIVERMVTVSGNDGNKFNTIEARLFQAQLLITEERYSEAGWILDHVADLIEESDEAGTDAFAAYHWYLVTLIHPEPEYIVEASERVGLLYKKNKSDWRIAWLFMFLSDEFGGDSLVKWNFLKKIFEYGGMSPIIYLEAIMLLTNNPALLGKLGNFELQVINFGVKNDYISQEIIEQMLPLCSKKKGHDFLLIKILQAVYERRNDSRILQEICTLLIKEGKTGEQYLKWYKAGVELQLRITNIYEYYMSSIDLDKKEEIPDAALIYFSYQNNLDYEKKAYLFRYISEHKDSMAELYNGYHEKIAAFVVEQINKEHINRDLAVLYKEFIIEEMINAETADALSRILFTVIVKVSDNRIKKLYAYQPGMATPTVCAVVNMEACLPVYGSDCTFVFEDAYGNRFAASVEHFINKLILPGKLIPRLRAFSQDNPNFDLYMCQDTVSFDKKDSLGMERRMRLIKSGVLTDKCRRDFLKDLIEYYYECDNVRAFEECIKLADEEEYGLSDRGEIIKYVIMSGNIDTAYNWIKRYGPYFVEQGTLLKLLRMLFEKEPDREETVISAAAAYVFSKGRYDSGVLNYLIRFYKGSTRNLRDIWKAAGAFEVETYYICEKIILQMLFTGAYVGEKYEIFKYYVSQGTREDVEEAFLAQCSYDYFVKDRITDTIVFKEIAVMCKRSEGIKRVSKLAFLKFYAENKNELTDDILSLAEGFLEEFMAERIHLNFFRKYTSLRSLLREMEDKTIIEYNNTPGTKARIHYVLSDENGEDKEYMSDYMQEVCSGVCFKEFILFFGEKLQYYIVEETDAGEKLTESKTIQYGDEQGDLCDNRFAMINDIIISESMMDYDTLDRLLEEYFRREYFNGELFKLL